MSRATLKNVPIKHLHPAPDMVLVEQHDTTQTESGIQLPDVAKLVVHVAKKVGSNIKHVEPGDVVILRDYGSVTYVHEVKGPCALVPGGAIVGVIRGYDWKSVAYGQARQAILAS